MPARPTPTRTVMVSKTPRLDLGAGGAQRIGQRHRVQMHPLGDGAQPDRPMEHRIENDAITASSACAVQTFEVAFSRRICCSRVCRTAGKPCCPWRRWNADDPPRHRALHRRGRP